MRTGDTQDFLRPGDLTHDRDKGHLAVVVDLRKVCEIRRRELADSAKESRVQVPRCDLGEKLAMLRRVFRPDGSEDQAPAAVLDFLLELARIGPDRKSLDSARRTYGDAYARIERDDTPLIREQRVDVELGDLGDVTCKLRQFHQCRFQGWEVYRGMATDTREQP